MPHSIPSGLTREHILRAIDDLDAGIVHPFGAPTKYELVHESRRYAPKAIIGLACRSLIGRVLGPEEFSGGESPGQANYLLRRLGFTVVAKDDFSHEEQREQDERIGSHWSSEEVQLLVADYFEMLLSELWNQPYNKAAHRRHLSPKLPGRSDGSIEFKHQNVSGVLLGRGLPYIEGYKPRMNYQELLATEVEAYLDQHPDQLAKLAASPDLNPEAAPPLDSSTLDDLVEEPPQTIFTPTSVKPWLSRRSRKLDFAERDAANRRLGMLGEQFVVDFERQRLLSLGRDDLAYRVEWASQSLGDGLGFDVISFDDADDSERLLEVKTTGLGKFFPFFVTGNEVRCSDDVPDQFQLFRVFDFGKKPRLYILHGSLNVLCQLDPVLYRASPQPSE